ncbi:MAG: DedA family protein [Clostridia bacterium]|nr:DedA family protein [Clostridia bacterium]
MTALHLVHDFMAHYGYLALFCGMALESLAMPVFSEIVLAYAGYLVGRGELAFLPSLAASVAGSLGGALVAYEVGRRGGRALLQSRLGRWIPADRVERYEARLRRSLGPAVVLGRILSGVRSVSSYVAGILRLPRLPFLAYSALGATIWSGGILLAGVLLGERWETLVALVHSFGLAATLFALAAVVAVVLWRRTARGTRPR